MEEVLRIELFQNSANYRKEETVDNKMTYPLPPFSTVIGALHNACGLQEYHPMELSIQGKYGSLVQKPYTDHCFLNSTQDDRGILAKMKNADLLSTAFDKVASAKKSQGNSFRTGITIQVHNQELLQEYRDLKDLNDNIKEFKDKRINRIQNLIKRRKKTLADKKKNFDKTSAQFKLIDRREKEIKILEKEITQRLKDYEDTHYKKPISRFRTLTTSLKYYELLTNVELIIHVKSDRETLQQIKDHIYDLKSIGRSEDFVEVRDVCFVELKESIEEEVESLYSAYIDYDLIKNNYITSQYRQGISANGTKYYITKNYTIKDRKRIFEKKKVVYVSGFKVDEENDNVYLDIKGKNEKYIVSFL